VAAFWSRDRASGWARATGRRQSIEVNEEQTRLRRVQHRNVYDVAAEDADDPADGDK